MSRTPDPAHRRRARCTLLALLVGAGLVGCDGAARTPGSLPARASGRPSFDAGKARALVDSQVAFGPRIPGREGHAAQLTWMLGRLNGRADTVVADTFTVVHTQTGEVLTLTNVMARFAPESERRILFLTHWDTRPRSDAARTPEERALPVPGANDGASGSAVLLQVAAHLAAAPPPVGVDLLWVDGEDYGPTSDDMFLGARRFASTLGPSGRPVYAVLLDMVGDRDPRFPIEGYSADLARPVALRVWAVAERLGFGDVFPQQVGQRLGDDHLPLNEAGIPTVDVIDFEYGPDNVFWHTPEDLPARTSARTLGLVGELVLELIYMGG